MLYQFFRNLDEVNGATKLYFMHYSCVVIILLSTSLYKSVFSTYSFCKTRFSSFCVLAFYVFISLVLRFYYFCSSFCIQCHLKRLNNILYICFYKNHVIKNMLPERFVHREKCHLQRKILISSFIKKNLDLLQN